MLFIAFATQCLSQKTPLEVKSSYYFFDPTTNKQVGPNYDLVLSNPQFDNYIVCVGGKKDETSYNGEFKGGKWGLIDKYGAEVLPLIYDKIEFESSHISITLNELIGLTDKRGQIIIEPLYSYIHKYDLPNYWYGRNASDLYGMVSGKGNTILPFEFTKFQVTKDYVIAENEKGTWLFNLKGEKIFSTAYDEIEYLSIDDNDFFLVKSGAYYQLLDANSKVIIEQQKGMEKVYDDSYQIISFMVTKGGKIGLISLKGEVVFQPIYDDLKRVELDDKIYFIAKKDKKVGVIDQNGKNIISFQYDFIDDNYTFGNNFIVSNDGKWEEDYNEELVFNPSSYKLVNTKGKTTFNKEISKYELIQSWSSSKQKLIFKSNGLWGVINDEFQTVVPNIYTSLHPAYNDGYIATKGASVKEGYYEEEIEGGSWHLLNSDFQEITTTSYDFIKSDSYTYGIGYIVEKSGQIGMIDLSGQEFIPCVYSDFECNDNGCIVSKYDSKNELSKYGMIDLITGKEVIPCDYEYLNKLSYNNSNFLARKNKMFGLIDNSGQIIVDFKYDFLGASGNDQYLLINQFGQVRNSRAYGGKFGLINMKGNTIIPCEYKSMDAELSDSVIICETFDGKAKIYDLTQNRFIEIEGVEGVVDIDEKNGIVIVGKSLIKDDYGYTISGLYGAISNKYKWIAPIEYNAISVQKNYIVAVDSLNNASDLYAINGSKLLENYTFLKSFNDSLVIVSKEGKRFNLFNVQNQKNVLKEEYLSLISTSEGFFWSQGANLIAQNDKNFKGVINSLGKVVIPFDFCDVEYCYFYQNPQYIVSSCPNINKGIPGKFGVISATGNIIIPMEYDTIIFDGSSSTYNCLLQNKEIYFDENGEKINK